MQLFTSILGALALAGAALAQGGATISVYPTTGCGGDPGGIESGLVCNNCYPFNPAWGSVSMSGFSDDWIWYGFDNNSCQPNGGTLGFKKGNVCFASSTPISSIFLKCNGNPGF
ncbi:hypothetical protein DFH08DRAFT_930870 [Mycena albidolilacea]|uniref:Uncharacterized protein n=1 Tax=Mycena albidolilacea TaxID=1033008 RepID=A0AAD7F155_9AGAR|nr:hypothetical protein DFH08DRAFT_930870 [Mycena albidolilacea]